MVKSASQYFVNFAKVLYQGEYPVVFKLSTMNESGDIVNFVLDAKVLHIDDIHHVRNASRGLSAEMMAVDTTNRMMVFFERHPIPIVMSLLLKSNDNMNNTNNINIITSNLSKQKGSNKDYEIATHDDEFYRQLIAANDALMPIIREYAEIEQWMKRHKSSIEREKERSPNRKTPQSLCNPTMSRSTLKKVAMAYGIEVDRKMSRVEICDALLKLQHSFL